jgi:hypothetical protein
MKTTITENYRVIIYPRSIGDFGWASISPQAIEPNYIKRQEMYKDKCEEIIDDVKRHVNNVGSVNIEYDSREICEFCKSDWEQDEVTGEPQCCVKAVKEFENLLKTNQTENG